MMYPTGPQANNAPDNNSYYKQVTGNNKPNSIISKQVPTGGTGIRPYKEPTGPIGNYSGPAQSPVPNTSNMYTQVTRNAQPNYGGLNGLNNVGPKAPTTTVGTGIPTYNATGRQTSFNQYNASQYMQPNKFGPGSTPQQAVPSNDYSIQGQLAMLQNMRGQQHQQQSTERQQPQQQNDEETFKRMLAFQQYMRDQQPRKEIKDSRTGRSMGWAVNPYGY